MGLEGYRQNRMERPKSYTEKLKGMLEVVAQDINEEARQHDLGDLVNPDCTISMQRYLKGEGEERGIYTQEQIDRDVAEIKKLEIDFSGAGVESVQKYFLEDKKISTVEGIVEHWKKSKENNKNGQMEMAITALLHKMMGKSFLVVRTATLDDYKSGLDNLILDKETGEAICAFDEVHEGGGGERTEKKNDKVINNAKKGGARAKYGIKLEEGKLKRSSMENLPLFYLKLKSDDLLKLMSEMQYDLEGETEVERKVFGELVKSLRGQKEMLLEMDLPQTTKNKLEKFEATLQKLEQIVVSS